MAGFFPMFVRLTGRVVVVVGGGDLAVRTVHTLLNCDAEVRVICPTPSREFKRFRGAPNLTMITRALQNGDFEDALLAIAVDDDPSVNLQAARHGLEWNVLVSVADELVLSDFVVPSFVHRGGLTLALHASALSAALARRISDDLERGLGPHYGDFIAALEHALQRINHEIADPEVRKARFERLLQSDLLETIGRDGPAAADARIDALLNFSREAAQSAD